MCETCGLFRLQKILRANPSTWHVIQRDLSAWSLIPVWSLVLEQHPQFESAAGWLKKAWLRETQLRPQSDLFAEERRRIESMGQIGLKEKIKVHLEKFQDYIFDASEGDRWLLEWLRKLLSIINGSKISIIAKKYGLGYLRLPAGTDASSSE